MPAVLKKKTRDLSMRHRGHRDCGGIHKAGKLFQTAHGLTTELRSELCGPSLIKIIDGGKPGALQGCNDPRVVLSHRANSGNSDSQWLTHVTAMLRREADAASSKWDPKEVESPEAEQPHWLI